MKKNLLALLCIIATTAYSNTNAPSEKVAFDILATPSLQSGEKDWWHWVPEEFGPKLSQIKTVCKEQRFNLFVIFNHYQVTSNQIANLTYDATMTAPDGTVDFAITNALGWNKKIGPNQLIPAESTLSISVDPEDLYGEYTIQITATDHISSNRVEKTVPINAIPFELPTDFPQEAEEVGEWFATYALHPDPVEAMACFLHPPQSYFDKNKDPIWPALHFYTIIFKENPFLIPHILTFFESATEQQQKDIALLFWSMNQLDDLPGLSNPVQKLSTSLKESSLPNPYDEITMGSQQDMLWAEFFATGRVRPLRQLLTSLDLSEHLGTLEKLKNKEVEPSEEVLEKALLEAVFQAGFWSIQSNCKQSDRCLHYFIALERHGELPKQQHRILRMILEKVMEDRNMDSSNPKPNDS